MAIKSILLLAGLAALATAQTGTSVVASSTQSQAMPAVATQGFNPGNVTTSLKYDWCLSQQHVCVAVCGTTSSNGCDAPTLTYNCICANGTAPDVTRYKGSLPYLICLATYDQCIAAHPDDAQGQGTCTSNEDFCVHDTTDLMSSGTGTGSATATTGTATGTGSGSGSGSATSSAASTSSSGSATTNTVTPGAFAALCLAIFKLVL